MMKFLVIEFSSEIKEFAVIPLDKVADGNYRAQKEQLVNKRIDVQWGKKNYLVNVRGFGTKRAMETLCNQLATEAANSEVPCCSKSIEDLPSTTKASPAAKIKSILGKRKSCAEKSCSKSSKGQEDDQQTVDVVLDQTISAESNDVNEQQVDNPAETNIQSMKERIQKLEASVKKYKKRAKEMKKINTELKQQYELSSAEDTLELHAGSGVFLSKTVVAAAKLSSKSPPILARNLFRQLFSSEEMKGHSLFGRACNANKTMTALPAVDSSKRDALIEFSLACFNLKASANKNQFSEYGVQKNKILCSLTKLLREKSCPE